MIKFLELVSLRIGILIDSQERYSMKITLHIVVLQLERDIYRSDSIRPVDDGTESVHTTNKDFLQCIQKRCN